MCVCGGGGGEGGWGGSCERLLGQTAWRIDLHMLGSTKINYLRLVSVASVGIRADILRNARSRESVAYACKISALIAMGRKSSLPSLAKEDC